MIIINICTKETKPNEERRCLYSQNYEKKTKEKTNSYAKILLVWNASTTYFYSLLYAFNLILYVL